MPSLLLIQWGVVGFFVVIHFLFGFLRGSHKSTYFTIVSLIMTIVTIWIISMLSFNLIFQGGFTLDRAIELVEGLLGQGFIPDEYRSYISDPAVVAILFAILDLVLRLIAFFLFYPVIKTVLTFIIFKPIWKRIIKPMIIDRQNQKLEEKYNAGNYKRKKFVRSRRIKKTILGRFIGATMGAVRGFVVAFVLLVPILVIAGFASDIPDIINLQHQNDHAELSEGNPNQLFTPEINDILAQINELNTNGLGAFARQITISEKALDRYIFDQLFTTKIQDGSATPKEISLGQELENIVGIAKVAYEAGYLNSDFDFNTISSNDLDSIEQVFVYLGQSNLIAYMIPFATKFGVSEFLPDIIGVNLYDRPHSKKALDQFTDMDWSEEFYNFYLIVEAILEFGSVAEIQNLLANPELLAELTPDEGVKLANIIRSLGNLQILALTSVGVDYLTTLDSVKGNFTWLDLEDVEGYLQDRLAFIIQNPNFFIGNDGDIANIANLIEFLFDETVLQEALLANQEGDLEALLDAIYGEWLGSLIDQFIEIRIIMDLIPIGVDFGLYNAMGEFVDRELADQMAERLNEVNWDDELINIGAIYGEVFKLGVLALVGTENPEIISIVDNIILNHLGSVRTIVEKIFEESEVINATIEILSPALVERFVSDEDLKEIVLDVLIQDKDENVVDFRFGVEINNILTIIESIYTFTTIQELSSITELELESQIAIFSRFGGMNVTAYNNLILAFENMQVLSRAGQKGLEYLKNSQNIEQLYVPTELSLGSEIAALIGIVYQASKYIYANEAQYLSLQDMDFAPLFANEDFRDQIFASNLMLFNIAHNIKFYAQDASISNFLVVPEDLQEANVESLLWRGEVTSLLSAILDFVASFENSDALTLSLINLVELSNNPMDASLKLITQYSDYAQANLAFGSLDASKIFRASATQAVASLGDSFSGSLNGYQVKLPDLALEEGILKEGAFVELIVAISTLADDMIAYLGYTKASELSDIGLGNGLEAFNQVKDSSLVTLSESSLIRGLISELILSPQIHELIQNTVNNTGIVTVSNQFMAFKRVDQALSVDDLSELLIAIRSFSVTEALINDPAGQLFTYLQSLDPKLDLIFDGTIIKEIFTFILTDEEIILSLSDLVSNAYIGIQSANTILGQVNPNFESIIRQFGSYQDLNNLYDTNEIKALIRAFNHLNINSTEELSALSDLTVLHQKLNDQPVIASLFENRFLYDQVNYVFTNEDLQETLANLANSQIEGQLGISANLTKDDVSFSVPKYGLIETEGPRIGGIKVSEINQFILSATRINWLGVNIGGTATFNELGNILLEVGTDSIRNIDYIVDSKLLMAIFDKVLNFEAMGTDQIAIDFANNFITGLSFASGVSLSKEFLHYHPNTFDANGVIRKEEIISMVIAFDSINFNQPIMNAFYELADNKAFDILLDSFIIHSLVSNVFVEESILIALAEVATNRVQAITGSTAVLDQDDVSLVLPKYQTTYSAGPRIGMVSILELEKLVSAAGRIDWANAGLGSGAGIVTNISNTLLAVGSDGERHIDVVVESRFVMAILDKALNFEYNTFGADEIIISFANGRIENIAALSGLVLSPSLLHFDDRVYDANQVIDKVEIVRLIESMSKVNLTGSIGLPTFYDMIDSGDFDEIFNSLILHSLISNVLTSTDVQAFGVSKVNGLQTIVVLDNDFLSVDPILMDGDLFKTEEIKNIFVALRALGLSDSASFNSIGLSTFSSLNGRNEEAGVDDFDRVFGANYVYILLDRILKLESLGDYVGTVLGNALGITIDSFDLTPSAAMLGPDILSTPEVEVGRVPKAEFRRMFTSFGLLGDISSIGLGTFLNMIDQSIDPDLDNDDFMTFIASDFIYTVLARMLENEGFGNYIGDILGSALGDSGSFDMTPPSDAKGQIPNTVEEDLMTRREIRQLMVSFKLLGLDIDTNIDINRIMSLIGQNEVAGVDDMHRFLESIYIQDKISILLLSDGVIELIANGRFDKTEFIMPTSATDNVDGKERLTKTEIYDLFKGLDILGLSDLDGGNLGIDTIIALDDTELNQVLASTYLYVVIDLMLKSESSLVVPGDAIETSGDYDGMIKKSEIINLINALDILGITNFDTFDPNTITLDDIEALLDLLSPIVDQLISDAIVEALIGPDDTYAPGVSPLSAASTKTSVITEIPLGAYNLDQTRLLRSEMYALLDALRAMGILSLETAIDVNNITVLQLKDVHNIGLGIDPIDDVHQSLLVHRILSEAIGNQLTIPTEAYMLGSTIDLLPNEISALLEALTIMGLNNLSDDIDVNAITVLELRAIHYLGLGINPDGDIYESRIIHRLISEAIIDQDSLIIPDGAYMTIEKLDINPLEISALIEALIEMGISTLADDIDVNTISTTQLRKIHYLGLGIDPIDDQYQSLILHKLISDQVEIAVTVPSEAYTTISGDIFVKPEEVSALIEALIEMGIATLSDDIDVNAISIAQLRNIHYLGLGTDPVDDEYESLILHKLISDQVELAVDVPASAFFTLGLESYVLPEEISALIEALDAMGLANLGDTIDVNALTTTQLRAIHYLGLGIDPDGDTYESITIHKLISDQVELAVDVPASAFVTIGGVDYVQPLEIEALTYALDAMGLNNLGDTIDVNALTTTQLRAIHYLGLGIDPDGDLYESITIHKLISDQVELAVTVPLSAFVTIGGVDYVQPLEIEALTYALDAMGLANLGDTIDVNTLTTTQLRTIHYLGLGIDPDGDIYESIVIHKLISDAVIDAVVVPLDAREIISGASYVKPIEVLALTYALDEMGLANLGDTIEIDLLTTTQLKNIHYLGLGIDPDGDLYESLIIHKLISDQVEISVDVPEDAFVEIGGEDFVKPMEVSALIAALEEMGLTSLGSSLSFTTLTRAQLQSLHDIGLGIGAPNTYDSLIVHRLISDTIINSLDTPDDAYMVGSTKDLLADEIQALILAMEEMSITTLDASIEFSNPTRTNLENLHYLGLGINPVEDLYESLIVHRLLSDSVITALDVPDDAYMVGSTKDLKPGEIGGLIAAMEEMGIASLGVGLAFTNPTRENIEKLNLIGLDTDGVDPYDSYIVHRLLSDAIISTLDVPNESYMPGSTEDVKVAEIKHITDSMAIINVDTLDDFAAITTAQLAGLTSGDIEFMVESITDGPNYIVYYFLSEVVDSTNTLFDTLVIFDPVKYPEPADYYYVFDGPTRVRLTRDALASALDDL
jgi:hypothetical protein